MIVDKALEVLQILLRDSGDAGLGKGGTQKFLQSMFTRLDGIGQIQAWARKSIET